MLPVHFAPLQGYTEAPYRKIHQQVCSGIDTYYTPFIRLEHGNIRKKDLREALPEQNQDIHVVPQIIASGKEEATVLIDRLVEIGHHEIDINMGCPFPPQARAGRGSGILPHADKVREICETIAEYHQQAGIEFSIKMRLGQNATSESTDLLPLLNDTPLKHITLHPRLGINQYNGALDMEGFERFYQGCHLPLIFNGMLTRVEEIQSIEQQYCNLSGIMIGRGLLSRPTLAAEYQNGSISNTQVMQKVLEMHRSLLAHYETAIEGGEDQLVKKMQTFWEYLEPLFGHKAIKKIQKSGSMRNYREAVANVVKLG